MKCRTYGEWLQSIIDPGAAALPYRQRIQDTTNFKVEYLDARGTDLLSPPPCFSNRSSDMQYAMGKLRIEDTHGLVIVEFREFGKPSGENFKDFARRLKEYAAKFYAFAKEH